MSNEVYFRPVEGVGTAAQPKTEAERKKLEEQLKLREQQARAEFIRQQYAQAERDRIAQEARGDRPNAVTNLAKILGTAAVVSQVSEQVLEENARLNAIETPIVTQFASRTDAIANNPYRDANLLAAMVDSNGEYKISDANAFQDILRQQELLKRIFENYKANEELRTKIEQHLESARQAHDQIFPKSEFDPTKDSGLVNKSASATQVQQTFEVRSGLHEAIARDAETFGSRSSQQLAAEVTAAFLIEQARKIEVVRQINEERARQQEEIRGVLTRQQAQDLAGQERQAQAKKADPNAAVVGLHNGVNLDREQQLKIEELKRDPKAAAKAGITPPPTGPNLDEQGNYIDPNRDKKEFDKKPEPVQVAPIDARVAAYDADGRATDDHTKIDSLGAELGQAADQAGVRTGKPTAVRPVSTIENNGAVSRIDGLDGPRFAPVHRPGTNN